MPPERRTQRNSSKADTRTKRPRSCQPIAGNSHRIFKQVTDPVLSPHKISIPDADIYYVPDFFSTDLANGWYEELARLSTWYRPTLKVYGRSVIQSREIAAYAND